MGKDGWFLGKELSRGGAEGLTLTPLFAPLTNTLLKMNTLTEARHPFVFITPSIFNNHVRFEQLHSSH